MSPATCLTVLLILAGAVAAGEPPVPDFALPESALHEPMPAEPDAVHVWVTAEGVILLGGKRYAVLDGTPEDETTLDPRDLKSALYRLAEGRREIAHEAKPCARAFVVHADARAPFGAVAWLTKPGFDPMVRIYRWYWAVRPGEEGERRAIPVFSLKDRGLAPGPFVFPAPLSFVASLTRDTAAEKTRIGANGAGLGRGSDGLDPLGARIAAVRRRTAYTATIVTGAFDLRKFRHHGEPPLEPEPGYAGHGEVVQVLTMLRNAGFASVSIQELGQDWNDRYRNIVTNWRRTEIELAVVWIKAEKALRERFLSMCAEFPEGTMLLDAVHGLSPQFCEAVQKEARWAEVGDTVQSLYLDGTMEPEVFHSLLDSGSLDIQRLDKILYKKRDRIFLLTALVRAWLEVGGEDRLTMARALCGILTFEYPRYTPEWWGREVLGLEALCALACDHDDAAARTDFHKRLGVYEELRLMDGCPQADEIRELARREMSDR